MLWAVVGCGITGLDQAALSCYPLAREDRFLSTHMQSFLWKLAVGALRRERKLLQSHSASVAGNCMPGYSSSRRNASVVDFLCISTQVSTRNPLQRRSEVTEAIPTESGRVCVPSCSKCVSPMLSSVMRMWIIFSLGFAQRVPSGLPVELLLQAHAGSLWESTFEDIF